MADSNQEPKERAGTPNGKNKINIRNRTPIMLTIKGMKSWSGGAAQRPHGDAGHIPEVMKQVPSDE